MKLKKIRFQNWQKHSDLTLDFNDNLNIITGLTGTGKSCVRRAISWLFFNDNISEADYRKEGTKETIVTGWLDNGFEVEKIRSNSINRYILRHKDSEDKIFDSIGKTIPEEILNVIQVAPIEVEKDSLILNIANQITLPFLLDKPASFRAKLFNKLTGSEALDLGFKELNKENLRINREIKETEENLEKQEEELSEYSQKYKNLKMKSNLLKHKFQLITENVKIYEQMLDLADKVKTNKEGQEFVFFKISKIKLIAEEKIKNLKEKAEELKKYQNLFNELESINNNFKQIEEQKKKIKISKIDFDALRKKNATLITINQLFTSIEQNKEQQKKVIIQTQEQQRLYGNSEKALKEIWDKQEVCPLCKKKINV